VCYTVAVKSSEKKIIFPVRLEPRQVARLEKMQKTQGTNSAWVIRTALDEFFARQDKEAGKKK
jgi:predicted transcriptional regulator